MPNSTVPANATALSAANLTPVGSGSSDLFVDFDADDSGATQHVVDDAPRVFPWSADRCTPIQPTQAR